MDPRTLIINLEYPYTEHDSFEVPARNVVLAGLGWETEYWPSLAVAWIEQGASIDKEVKEALDLIVEKKQFPQSLRHRAFALVRRWEQENASSEALSFISKSD
ncbi:hypothetical protein [Methylobacter sp. BBA5.1]|uniref:hypothetical protein n=1 Tax=Methylobacter sp. BBA5.1 TaxID=1495064 RepID=UPI00068F9C93|nr:hypothetical protein [Methylobacter sp. BBA5.1]